MAGMHEMVWRHTLRYLVRLDERRQQAFAAIETPEQVQKLSRYVRQHMARTWGPLPSERTALNARHVGTVERNGFHVEKIVFESRPEFFVTANLYKPAHADGRLPAVLFPPGHTDDGKTAEAYQRFAILMARNGFAVLTWDPLGQGERLQLWDDETKESRLGPGTAEHRAIGNACYLVGLNLMQFRAWDAMRALDYLQARPDIDGQRIAMAGNSGGGMETLQVAPMESRIKAAVTSCAVATFRAKTQAFLIADPEQILVDTLRAGVDHPELLASFAPRPLLIASALQDYVPIAAAQKTFADVQRVYELAGVPERISMTTTDAEHGYHKELREASASWLVRWLADGAELTPEDDAEELIPPDALWCTPSGQVAASLGGQSAVQMLLPVARRAPELHPVPRTVDEHRIFTSKIAADIKRVTRVGQPKKELGVTIVDRALSAGERSHGLAFVVADRGFSDRTIRGNAIDPVLAAGWDAIGLDLRGWGESAAMMAPGLVTFKWDDFFAYRWFEMGRPLLGQRMKDLLAHAPGLANRRTWAVVGVGPGALVALHAAAIEPRISHVITVDGLLSYRSLVEGLPGNEALSSYVPGVLQRYDIRHLHAAVAPRPVLVINPRDGSKGAVTDVGAWEELDWAAQAYEAIGAAGRLEVKTGLTGRNLRESMSRWLRESA